MGCIGFLDKTGRWGNEADGMTHRCNKSNDISISTLQSEAFDTAYARIQSQAKSFHKFVPLVLPNALSMDGELAHRKLFSKCLDETACSGIRSSTSY